ncbi:acetyltransferase [Staphylococcus microti]|uniref:Acetyltransferase n=1 Tax=Staphylococcus microti TaxID=569857 RepID=A0A0D6XQV5_9STAP|nr:N-acetyltransferase [Staphylococcus microti]KIX90223.1 acetyltransferase [Staphylococcus microti]PNZ81367.1 N-acetyltransferase [Staphylococcus microti]SUM56543.1 GNAT family acetyltransferase [Staphylococcus microti]
MSIFISTLTEMDYEPSLQMIENTFEDVAASNHNEAALVKGLRMAPDYRYELEVIAKTADDDIIGHAMCSEVTIQSDDDTYIALALAPLSVAKAYQHKGIGKALVQALEERAYAQEYTTIVVLGHPDYYAQLGYEVASKHEITVPFNVPDEAVRVKFLWDSLENPPHGEVQYPDLFFNV